MVTEHTYLFKPGLWSIDGRYYDENKNGHLQTGQLLVSHGPELWTIDSQLNISGQDIRDFVSRYEITPFAAGAAYSEWKSMTGGPEPIFGLFVVVEDCLMMSWQSRTGVYWGQEALTYKNPEEYVSHGYAFIKDKLVSSFNVTLSRVGGSEAREAE